MAFDPRIPQILSRWQSAERKPTAEELCVSCPELLPHVRQMIDALEAVVAGATVGGTGTEPSLGRGSPGGEDVSDLDFPVAAAAQTPEHIGPYRIIATLGSGGMGVVYKAEQRQPVKRLVALKLIKLGMDTRHVIARFESERQALALMDHANVAKVLDAGATDAGRPYFVMEYVPGEPITEYCDKNRLTTEERLNLFMLVCDAVQHAHQKGIIHRDLKPGNILVEYRDGRAVPKVIDFGIAKATRAHLTEKTLYTEHGQMVGTPEYASPEQAETSGLDVDTRTDIYSLGVILYELLTGKLPFDSKTLRSAGYVAMQRIIREEDPPKPSTRLTRLGEELGSIAKRRRTEPRTLTRSIRGELDWIILRAMDKDRQRRYDTAAALAQDLTRHLRDEPVSAGPPTATYRVGKFIKRHMLGITAGAAVAVALLVGLGLAVMGFYQARQQRDQALRAESSALVAKGDAERESLKSRQITDYLRQMLVAVDPEQARAMDVTLDSVLNRSRELFGDDHVIIAAVLSARANSLRSGGQLEEAERALLESINAYRTAYGPEHGAVAAALTSLGGVQKDRGDYPAAEQSLRQALEIKRRAFGPRSRQVAETLEAIAGVVLVRAGPSPQEREQVRELLYETYHAFRESHGETDRRTVEIASTLGIWLSNNGMYADAEPILARAVELGRTVLGDKSELWFNAMNSLTRVYVDQQKNAQAREQWLELDQRASLVYGAHNPIVLQSALSLANWLLRSDDLGTADAVLRRAIQTAETAVPRGDPMLTELKRNLVEISLRRKNADRKWLRDFWLEYLEDRRLQYASDPEKLIPPHVLAARTMLDWGYARDAERLYQLVLPMQQELEAPDQAAISDTLLGLGTAMMAGGQTAQAEGVLAEALEIRRRVLREGDWQIAEAQGRLGECLLELGRYQEATPLLNDASDVLDSARLATTDTKIRTLDALAKLYSATGKQAEADDLRQKMTASTQPSTAPAESTDD
jgi:eukaryotic-like serine/threonine-protein kinase